MVLLYFYDILRISTFSTGKAEQSFRKTMKRHDEKCVIISPWRKIKLRFSVTFTGALASNFSSHFYIYVSSHTERKSKGHKSHDYLITMTAKSTQNKQLENGKFSFSQPEFIVPYFHTQHTHNIFTDFSLFTFVTYFPTICLSSHHHLVRFPLSSVAFSWRNAWRKVINSVLMYGKLSSTFKWDSFALFFS